MTLTYFNIYMGFKTHESIRIEGLKAPPSTFDKQAFWKEIMGLEVYNPNALKYSKDIDIKDVALRLAHRWIFGTIRGRSKTTVTVTLKDLFLLWCMFSGHHCNPRFMFIQHCNQIGKNIRKYPRGHFF